MPRDASSLPGWIPGLARQVYATTGPYSGAAAHLEKIAHNLFHAKVLEEVWRRLHVAVRDAPAPCDPWPVLLGGIIQAAGNTPPGSRATRDRPDKKIKILDNQAAADELVQAAAKQALALARTLRRLDGHVKQGASVPLELASGVDLLSSLLELKGGGAARGAFEAFQGGLSSAAALDWPPPARQALWLAICARQHGKEHGEAFAGNAWLESSHSSWRDFIRMARACFASAERMHKCRVELREVDWLHLAQGVLDPDITRSDVNACLRDLAE